MMARLSAATAAFLALSVHVLPVIGFALPSPQANTCITECTSILDTYDQCNISPYATSYTASQVQCMCSSSAFKTTVDSCMTCLYGDTGVSTYEYICSSSSSSSAASASRSTTRSASASATRSASASASVSATRTASGSSSGATQSSTASCAQSDACLGFGKALAGCGLTVDNVETITDEQVTCLCKSPDTFEADVANCVACSGRTLSGADTICDSFTSTSGLASGTARATSTARTTGVDSSGSTVAAITAGNPTTTAADSTPTSTSGSNGSPANVLSQNGGSRVVALGVPGLVVPVLVMATAVWRVAF